MITMNQLKKKRKGILDLASRHGALDIRVFGSVARGKAKKNSDIDFLVRFEPERSLLDMVAFELELQTLLKSKVEVLDEEGLSPYLRVGILSEALAL